MSAQVIESDADRIAAFYPDSAAIPGSVFACLLVREEQIDEISNARIHSDRAYLFANSSAVGAIVIGTDITVTPAGAAAQTFDVKYLLDDGTGQTRLTLTETEGV